MMRPVVRKVCEWNFVVNFFLTACVSNEDMVGTNIPCCVSDKYRACLSIFFCVSNVYKAGMNIFCCLMSTWHVLVYFVVCDQVGKTGWEH